MACPNDILDIFNPASVVSCGADAAAKGAAGNAFEQIVNYFSEGASAIAYGLTMGWMDFPTPDLTGSQNADGYTPRIWTARRSARKARWSSSSTRWAGSPCGSPFCAC